jgi:hypothetical protein
LPLNQASRFDDVFLNTVKVILETHAELINVEKDQNCRTASMKVLSDEERNLLRYYAETERIIHGPERGVVHQHLLHIGYIEERRVNARGASIVVTSKHCATAHNWRPQRRPVH